MGRKPTHPIKRQISFDQDMIDRIDDWRRTQTPIPNFSEALRALVDMQLASNP
jgi:hypothetical protein